MVTLHKPAPRSTLPDASSSTGHISSSLAGEEKTPPASPPSSDLLAHEPIAGATQTDGPERKSQGDAQIILPFTKKEGITNLTGGEGSPRADPP